jgi:hypothetical protein
MAEKNAASAVLGSRVVLVLLGYGLSWKTTQPVGNRSCKEAQVSSPESHELESFFEKLTQPPPEHTAHGQGDPAEEFNALFRKLSALDELNWAPEADHPAPARRPRAKAAPARQAAAHAAPADDAAEDDDAAVPAVAQAAMPAPKLTQEEAEEIASIIDANQEAPVAAAAERAQPAQAMPAARQVAPRPKRRVRPAAPVVSAEAVTASAAPRPGKLERAGRALKIATVSLALFGIGLGAVWAALTLPHRANHAQPTVAERAIPSAGETKPAAPARAVELPATAAELQITEVTPKPALPAARAEKPKAPAAPQATASVNVPVAPRTTGAMAPHAEPVAEPAVAHAADAGGFALQVGACASEQCLANYRSLLTNFVAPDTIRVIAAPAGEGAMVQRVRVAPLDLEQARKLKVAMAADARLRNAYVITLN